MIWWRRGIDTSRTNGRQRTGIHQRHLAAPEVTSSELAYEASLAGHRCGTGISPPTST